MARLRLGITATRRHKVNLGILGKYTALRDAYASIDKAIEHACTHLSIEPDVQWIDVTDITTATAAQTLAPRDLHAVIVPGGFGERGVEGKIAGVQWIRQQRIPFLGICLGFQVAVIEYARHVAGIEEAHSTEFRPNCPEAVISELPDQKAIEGLGGTMRLGGQDVLVAPGSRASWLFDGATRVRERFRHRYEVEPERIAQLEAAGLVFSGRHGDHPIMQMLELPREIHPYFIAAQFHPELTSRPLRPQPLFMGLLAAAVHRANPEASRESISSRWLEQTEADDEDPAAAGANATAAPMSS